MTKFEIQHTHSGWQSCHCSWVCSFVTNTMKSSDLHCYSNKYQRFFLVLFDQNWQLPVLAGIKSRNLSISWKCSHFTWLNCRLLVWETSLQIIKTKCTPLRGICKTLSALILHHTVLFMIGFIFAAPVSFVSAPGACFLNHKHHGKEEEEEHFGLVCPDLWQF